MATKYADIAKPSRDILNDDYTAKISLKCKKGAGPVGVTIESEQSSSGSVSSKIGTKFSYAKFNVDKAQVKADGQRILETSLKLNPELSVSFKASKGADLCLDFKKSGFYGTASLDVLELSNMTLSGCYSSKGFKVGGDTKYSISGGSVAGFSFGASYAQGPLFASLTTSKFSTFNVGMVYKVNDQIKLASMTTHKSDKLCDVLAVGGSYKSDIGTIKAKANMAGTVSACLVREVAPKVTMVASGSVAGADLATFKPGLSITM